MYNIDFTFNLFTLFAITAAAGIIGYAFRSRQIQKKQMKVLKLRREVMNNHASILELQKNSRSAKPVAQLEDCNITFKIYCQKLR